MALNWDQLSTENKQQIRDEMIEEMRRVLKAQRPDASAESIERGALHLVNVAISRNRKRQKREVACPS